MRIQEQTAISRYKHYYDKTVIISNLIIEKYLEKINHDRGGFDGINSITDKDIKISVIRHHDGTESDYKEISFPADWLFLEVDSLKPLISALVEKLEYY